MLQKKQDIFAFADYNYRSYITGGLENIKFNSVFGLPLQFVIVFMLGLLITVYLAAAAATARVEERDSSVRGESVSSYRWEQAAIWACPLH